MMDTQVKFTLLSAQNSEIDVLRRQLGAPNNRSLFPSHFLKSTFPRLGGRIVGVEAGENLVGVGFLFPRGVEGRTRRYTLRFHRIGGFLLDEATVVSGVETLLDGDRVVFYDPCVKQRYEATIQKCVRVFEDGPHTSDEGTHPQGPSASCHSPGFESVEVGTPSADEALAIQQLQQAIWESEPDSLYPTDIHSTDFHAGTSLVARYNGVPVGFLIGFYKFDGILQGDLRSLMCAHSYDHPQGRPPARVGLESQLLGVLRPHRARNIGFLLKKVQAERAQSEGIEVIHWTADPLQYTNARLNFGKLKAIASDFYRDYYSFRNELNRVSASRFGITWLINTDRVTQALADNQDATVINLTGNKTIRRFDRSPAGVVQNPRTDGRTNLAHISDKTVAIEIPGDWTALQRQDFEGASEWRTATDLFFERHLGWDEGKYMITGVGADGARRYLIAEQVKRAMLECLGR